MFTEHTWKLTPTGLVAVKLCFYILLSAIAEKLLMYNFQETKLLFLPRGTSGFFFRDKGFLKKCPFVRSSVRPFVRANWRNEESPFLGFLDFF